jgi:hypothetical protein
MVVVVSNDHEGALGGDCDSSWECKLSLAVALFAELAHQRSSADVADLDAMSSKFDSNEPVRMSSYECCTKGTVELKVAISSSSIAQNKAWLRRQLRHHLLRICLLH